MTHVAGGAASPSAECVIGNLDGDGRLNATNEEIAELSGCADERVEEARRLVMHLDPVGCGARDARECLLVQLEVRGDDVCPRGADGAWPRGSSASTRSRSCSSTSCRTSAKQIGVEVVELVEELQHIRTLDPYPGRRYSSEEPILIVARGLHREGGRRSTTSTSPTTAARACASAASYAADARPAGDDEGDASDFIKEKMRSAVDLLRNIEHRRQTIYRVVECIVRRQQRVSRQGRAVHQADDAQGRGRGHRDASLDHLARRQPQVRAHAAGRHRAAPLLHRGHDERGGRGGLDPHHQAQDQEADRGRGLAQPDHRRPGRQDSDQGGHQAVAPHRREVPRPDVSIPGSRERKAVV